MGAAAELATPPTENDGVSRRDGPRVVIGPAPQSSFQTSRPPSAEPCAGLRFVLITDTSLPRAFSIVYWLPVWILSSSDYIITTPCTFFF
ncbi:hypothetical protein MDA_GLEAN10011896 [Myotis davidii]|uniref:Uncharacterized protein n=1 Tax=Myotis davidii TaxID=225400 RepID=L5LWE6_MYODS|nr:hypothetical protein MDA_GLEAN10011896 [Myotis davidii]